MATRVKFVASWVRAHFGANDAGQNMVETALIIGLMSLVLVVAFVTTGITDNIADLAAQVACTLEANNDTEAGLCDAAGE